MTPEQPTPTTAIGNVILWTDFAAWFNALPAGLPEGEHTTLDVRFLDSDGLPDADS